MLRKKFTPIVYQCPNGNYLVAHRDGQFITLNRDGNYMPTEYERQNICAMNKEQWEEKTSKITTSPVVFNEKQIEKLEIACRCRYLYLLRLKQNELYKIDFTFSGKQKLITMSSVELFYTLMFWFTCYVRTKENKNFRDAIGYFVFIGRRGGVASRLSYTECKAVILQYRKLNPEHPSDVRDAMVEYEKPQPIQSSGAPKKKYALAGKSSGPITEEETKKLIAA